ncbi:retrovirus-related pol polyprotein from transposon TNT 1-94 [Tanacetum coccineum]
MSGTIPPIPPPFGASSGNPGSPNVNRVDTMPATTDPINTTNTTNVSQSVVDENLPQLLDSRGGSHVTNVPAFDKEDFTSWKVRFLVFLDGLEPYLLKTLEDGPFVPMSSLSTSENPLPKRQNQWSNAESRLANQDKRLKSIIISCLPNDVMKSVIKCKTTKEMWNDLILAHEGPSDIRDTKIAALRLKFNAFKSLEGEKVNGTFTRLKCLLNDLENNDVTIPQAEVNAMFVNSLPRKWLSMNQTQRINNSIKNDSLATLYGKYNYEEGLIDQIYESETQRFTIQASSSKALISNHQFQDSDSDFEEDQRTSNEFMADLNAEYHERALLANHKRFFKRSGREYPSHKTSTLSYPSSNNSFNKSKPYTPSFNQTSSQNSGNHQKVYKGKYKGLKAEMVVLTKRIDDITKGKSEKGKKDKENSEKGLLAESFDWDDKFVSSDDEGSTKISSFMEIAEDEPSVGKVDTRSGQWVDITMKKRIKGKNWINLENESLKDEIIDLKKVIEKWTCSKVTLDQLLSEQVPRNIVKALGGKGRRKEKISSKKEPLPPLPKLLGAAPSGTSKSLISLSDLTLNMVDLTLETPEPKKRRPSTKVSPAYVIKKKIEIYHFSSKPCSDKKANSSTEQLLLTLIEEVKGLKRQIEIPSGTHPSSTQPISSKASKQKTWFRPYLMTITLTTVSSTLGVKYVDYLKRSVWYLDSGCSRHMTGIKQYIRIYSKESGPKVVSGDDSSGDTEGYGLINYNGITFSRVAYVNDLKHNLISISQLCDANYKVLFSKTQGTIYNQNDEVVLIALRRRDVYVIDMSSFNKESNTCFFAKASPSVNWLLHKRLSYLNFKNINNLAKHNLVSGLPYLTFSKDKNCSACEKEKHHRASFKTKRSFSINKSLHLLHMDLFGPGKGARSDNGTEFRNHKLEEFCDEKGISQNFSSPCTPEQNGVFERRNRTLIEAARTMLNSAKLPKQFWGEAVNTTCYTQNRSIIVKRHGKTSYDVFRGISPDISYFHMFGCPIYIHNHMDHLGKFDEKADDRLFLGYSPVAKAFRVINIRR